MSKEITLIVRKSAVNADVCVCVAVLIKLKRRAGINEVRSWTVQSWHVLMSTREWRDTPNNPFGGRKYWEQEEEEEREWLTGRIQTFASDDARSTRDGWLHKCTLTAPQAPPPKKRNTYTAFLEVVTFSRNWEKDVFFLWGNHTLKTTMCSLQRLWKI